MNAIERRKARRQLIYDDGYGGRMRRYRSPYRIRSGPFYSRIHRQWCIGCHWPQTTGLSMLFRLSTLRPGDRWQCLKCRHWNTVMRVATLKFKHLRRNDRAKRRETKPMGSRR